MVLQVLDRRKGERSLEVIQREAIRTERVRKGDKEYNWGKREGGKDMSHWKAEQPEAAMKSQTPK